MQWRRRDPHHHHPPATNQTVIQASGPILSHISVPSTNRLLPIKQPFISSPPFFSNFNTVLVGQISVMDHLIQSLPFSIFLHFFSINVKDTPGTPDVDLTDIRLQESSFFQIIQNKYPSQGTTGRQLFRKNLQRFLVFRKNLPNVKNESAAYTTYEYANILYRYHPVGYQISKRQGFGAGAVTMPRLHLKYLFNNSRKLY